jgi:hypothetical protein
LISDELDYNKFNQILRRSASTGEVAIKVPGLRSQRGKKTKDWKANIKRAAYFTKKKSLVRMPLPNKFLLPVPPNNIAHPAPHCPIKNLLLIYHLLINCG